MKKKQKYISAESLHKKWMGNPAYRTEYEKLEPEFAIARTIIEARVKNKISQEELAAKVGTGQAVISRLENASASPSLSLIKRLAHALNLKVELHFMQKP